MRLSRNTTLNSYILLLLLLFFSPPKNYVVRWLLLFLLLNYMYKTECFPCLCRSHDGSRCVYSGNLPRTSYTLRVILQMKQLLRRLHTSCLPQSSSRDFFLIGLNCLPLAYPTNFTKHRCLLYFFLNYISPRVTYTTPFSNNFVKQQRLILIST